jgi:hypothetical protein
MQSSLTRNPIKAMQIRDNGEYDKIPPIFQLIKGVDACHLLKIMTPWVTNHQRLPKKP